MNQFSSPLRKDFEECAITKECLPEVNTKRQSTSASTASECHLIKGASMSRHDQVLAEVDELLNSGDAKSILFEARLKARLAPDTNKVLEKAIMEKEQRELETNPLNDPFVKKIFEVIRAKLDEKKAHVELYKAQEGFVAAIKKFFSIGRPELTVDPREIHQYFAAEDYRKVEDHMIQLSNKHLLYFPNYDIYNITPLGEKLYAAANEPGVSSRSQSAPPGKEA